MDFLPCWTCIRHRCSYGVNLCVFCGQFRHGRTFERKRLKRLRPLRFLPFRNGDYSKCLIKILTRRYLAVRWFTSRYDSTVPYPIIVISLESRESWKSASDFNRREEMIVQNHRILHQGAIFVSTQRSVFFFKFQSSQIVFVVESLDFQAAWPEDSEFSSCQIFSDLPVFRSSDLQIFRFPNFLQIFRFRLSENFQIFTIFRFSNDRTFPSSCQTFRFSDNFLIFRKIPISCRTFVTFCIQTFHTFQLLDFR